MLNLENFISVKVGAISVLDPDSKKITVVAGPNGSGKSTAIMALQLLASGKDIPDDIMKKEAAMLVHRGEEKAVISLTVDGKKSEIKYPKANKFVGEKLNVSPYALGLLEPAQMSAQGLSLLLKIQPNREDFDEMVKQFPDFPTEEVWKVVMKDGWDDAYKKAKTTGQDLKREWTSYSGKAYPDANAFKWFPDDYIDTSLEDLQKNVESAKTILDHALRSEGRDAKAKEDLQKKAEQAPGIRQSISDVGEKIGKLKIDLEKANAHLGEIPKILATETTYECEHCHTVGVIQGSKLVAPKNTQTPEEVAQINAKLTEQNGKITKLAGDIKDLELTQHELNTNLKAAEEADKQLGVVDLSAPSTTSVADARAALDLCERQLKAHKVKAECDDIAESVAANHQIQVVLNPDGLRKEVLAKKLDNFNELLSIICETAEWPLVQLDEALRITMDGFPFRMLSPGRKWAANAALQIAITKTDGSQLIVMDGIDVLDKMLLNGLITVLDEIPIPAVLGCKYTYPSEVPNFEDLGTVYWCQDGIISEAPNPSFVEKAKAAV